MEHVTVGIDIGTTSVKAVAADAGGTVLARARIPHRVVSTGPGQFEHDPQGAWIDGVLGAWEQVGAGIAGRPVAAVTVSAMVSSMCGVDSAGTPVTVGLLYGDARGRGVGSSAEATGGEADGFARWLAGCAAYHSRVTAGLEADTSQARRWGRVSHRVEPRAEHTAGAEGRYRRFREGTDR